MPSKNLFPTSSLTQEREKSSTDDLHNKIRRRVFLSYESLKSRKRRICFPTSYIQGFVFQQATYKGTYVEAVESDPFLPFDHSAILSAISPFRPPFRHSAIPPFPPLPPFPPFPPFRPFRHSRYSAIPPFPPFPSFDHSVCHSIPPFRLLFRHSHHYFCCGLRRSYINSVTPQPACLHLQFLSVYNSHNDK